MDVERLERVKELFEAALERDEPERSAFLDEACSSDPELRQELDSLLSGERNAGDFLQEPVAHISPAAVANDHPPATFSPSEIVSGRFQILRFIGRGGMGEVYEASDLERHVRVALKTIRPEIASNPKAMVRFKREIDLALRVTHHNVCRVYDLERHRPPEGSGKPEVVFLTMELLEGETLADRLRRQGRMSCEEALPLIRQMAEGLAAAHKEHVVHCDFKPGNVMLVSERPADVDSLQSTQSVSVDPKQVTQPAAGHGARPGEPPASGAHRARGETAAGVPRRLPFGSALAPLGERVARIASRVRWSSQRRAFTDSTGRDTSSTAASAPVQALRATPRAVITDFGLARAMRPMLTRESIQESLDTGNHLVGTLPYMAPEQLEGHAATTATDVYAFGLVMYEMVAGRQPFSGDTPLLAIYKRLSSAPPKPRTLTPGLDSRLESVIMRCLEREPGARYRDASEITSVVAQASRQTATPEGLARPWVWAGALLALLALFFGVLRYSTVRGPKPPVSEENLVVLPFTPLDGNPDEKVYCDGFTDVVTAQLAQIPSLTVAPAFEVQEKKVKNPDDARAELGATRVLISTWQRLGNEITITLVLIDVRTNRQLDARNVDHEAGDLYALKIEVVQAAVRMLNAEPPAFPAEPPAPSSVYDDYVKGRGYLQDYLRPENVDYAVAAFKDAIAQDSSYAPAHAGLGESYWQKFKLTSNARWVQETRSECQRAVTLNGRLADAHICLGTLDNGTGNYEEAVAEFQRALSLDARSDAALRGLASAYGSLNRPKDAEEIYLRAIKLRPDYWANYNWLGYFYNDQSRFADAAEMFKQVIKLAPDNYLAYSNLGSMYLRQGRYQEAEELMRRSVSIRPTAIGYSNLATLYFYLRRFADNARTLEQSLKLDDSGYDVWGNLGYAYYWAPGERQRAPDAFKEAVSMAKERLRVNPRDHVLLQDLAGYSAMLGDKEAALAYLNQGLALAPADPDSLLTAAFVHNQIGQTDEAMSWLKKALAAGASRATVRDFPGFDSLREDHRYQDLMRSR